MRERPIEDVAEDLHVAMRVLAEAGPSRHAVVVDHPERPESHVGPIVVLTERKSVTAAVFAKFKTGFGFGTDILMEVFARIYFWA